MHFLTSRACARSLDLPTPLGTLHDSTGTQGGLDSDNLEELCQKTEVSMPRVRTRSVGYGQIPETLHDEWVIPSSLLFSPSLYHR